MAENPLATLARLLGGVVLMQGNLGHQVLGQLLIMNTNEVAMAGAAAVIAGTTGQRSAVGQIALRTVAPALAVRVLLNKQEERLERKSERLDERERALARRRRALKRKHFTLDAERSRLLRRLAEIDRARRPAGPDSLRVSPPSLPVSPPAGSPPQTLGVPVVHPQPSAALVGPLAGPAPAGSAATSPLSQRLTSVVPAVARAPTPFTPTPTPAQKEKTKREIRPTPAPGRREAPVSKSAPAPTPSRPRESKPTVRPAPKAPAAAPGERRAAGKARKKAASSRKPPASKRPRKGGTKKR